MRRLGIYIVFALCHFALSASPWDSDSIKSIFNGRTVDPIEGVWQFPDDGARVLITKATATTYDIYLLDSPRLDIRPGVFIGKAVKTAQPGYYDGKIDSKNLGKHSKMKSSDVTFNVNSSGNLCIKPYKTGYTVSFRRLLSYFTHITVHKNSNKPDDLIGAEKIYPEKPENKTPVCL